MFFLSQVKQLSQVFRNKLVDKKLNTSLTVKLLLGGILIVLISSMFPTSESYFFTVHVGSVWADKDLIAPFSFPIYKNPYVYAKECDSAENSIHPIFIYHPNYENAQIESLNVLLNYIPIIIQTSSRLLRHYNKKDSLLLNQQLEKVPFLNAEINPSLLEKVIQNKTQIQSVLLEVLHSGIVDEGLILKTRKLIALRKGRFEELIPVEKLYDINTAISHIKHRLKSEIGDTNVVDVSMRFVNAVITPNIIFEKQETQNAIKIARDNVPRTLGFVQENERIVSKHERITEEIKQKLDSFQRAQIERGLEGKGILQPIGIMLHVTIVIGLYSLYLFLFRKKIFSSNTLLALIGLLLLMVTFFAYLSINLDVSAPLQYLIFIPSASMLLTILFDSRVAFYGTVTMAFLVAGIRGNDYEIALISLVAGAFGAYTVRDIRNRTQIFRSLGYIFLGYFVTIVSLGIQRMESVGTMAFELTFALANAVVSPVLTYGLLIFFERFFRVTTDLTLLELSDHNQPLLRQLSEKAPGTFHHSITIGNLAEAAAEAIGGNSILARVGAYYHDIGKLVKPEYFVENQQFATNKHSRLKPRMSAKIISSHIKEGIELGRQYNIPERVLDFIPQHHGTTLMTFFYDKALKQAVAKGLGKEFVQEDEFRYPGPKPQSKEAAIVMLADSVEALTRSLENITPKKLEEAIESMIKQRFVEGELDECDLTLRDLSKIKESFLKILSGIYHTRIQYPEPEIQRELQTIVETNFDLQSDSSKNLNIAEKESPTQKDE